MAFWLITIIVFLLALWNAFLERRRLKKGQWLFLSLLRLAGLALLAMALWELDPWGALAARRKPQLLAVVDGSRSMERRDGLGGTRYQRALADARSLAGRRDMEVRILQGGEGELEKPGKGAPAEYTDIGAWLARASAMRPDAIVLLSDGDNNAGTDPAAAAAAAGRPVYAVGYGPLQADKTPAILDAWSPQRSSLGKPIEVRASVRAGKRPLALSAEVDGSPAGSIRIKADGERTEVLDHTAGRPGIHRMRLFLIDGTDTLDRRTIAFRTEKERLRAVCLCGVPDWNLSFMRMAAAADPDIDLEAYVARRGGWEGIDRAVELDPGTLESADLLVLMNLRVSDLSPDLEKKALEAVHRKGLPVLFVGAAWGEPFRSREIFHLLPLRLRKRGEMARGRIEIEPGQLAKLLPGPDRPGEMAAVIRRMPPLSFPREAEAASKMVSLIAVGDAGGKKTPVWAWWYQGRSRVSLLTAGDLWSWCLGAPARNSPQGDSALYGRLVRGAFRWLAGMPGHAVEVGPDRDIYYAGEDVRIRGEYPLWEKGGAEPVWSVTVGQGGRAVRRQRMPPLRPGEYQAALAGLSQGSYDWSSELVSGGRVIDRSRGKFWVEPNPGEQGGHVQQVGLLRRLAEVSGGAYRDGQDGDGGAILPKDMRPRAEKSPGQAGPLALALAGMALIIAEWYWRRRWGLK